MVIESAAMGNAMGKTLQRQRGLISVRGAFEFALLQHGLSFPTGRTCGDNFGAGW